jgi:hypothetical protein
MRYRRSMLGAVCVVVALGCMLLGGCQKSSFKVAPVSGKVTLGGKPQPKLNVVFAPLRASQESQEAGMGSTAQTNDEGVYELTLADGSKKGAVVGRHRVTFARVMPASDSDIVTPLSPEPELDAAIKQILKSPVEIEVPAGGSKELNIELKK